MKYLKVTLLGYGGRMERVDVYVQASVDHPAARCRSQVSKCRSRKYGRLNIVPNRLLCYSY